jgi:hypothetical protein
MATKKFLLFVEGDSDTTNGNLRQGLASLLERRIGKKMPTIILGGGKSQTVHKFLKNERDCDEALLLVDLDADDTNIDKDLEEYNLEERQTDVFYMIHEMDAWFLSQPDVLDNYYGLDAQGKKVSSKIPKRPAKDIPNPDELLQKITKTTKKGTYHKISHAVALLKLIDPHQLERDFADFENLITRLLSE